MSPIELLPLDPAEDLTTDIMREEFIQATLEDGDPRLLAEALGIVARSKGMAQVAEETGLSRESLYKALSINGNPTLDTLMRVLKALGIRLRCELIPETEAEPNSEAKKAVPA